ncbi:MAG: hypothetical protein LBM99_01800 [Bacillales bacterium]|jgi:hypothetical protein|nr:hypothetical protein [Bacillales bacterium]
MKTENNEVKKANGNNEIKNKLDLEKLGLKEEDVAFVGTIDETIKFLNRDREEIGLLSYVYVDGYKIYCSYKDSNLPNFAEMGITEKKYSKMLVKYEDYRERERNYINSFYDNLGLFLDNSELIINEPKYANIMIPKTLYSSMYISQERDKITLGELLKLYINEPAYSKICPECHEKMFLIHFGFSPLSGRIFVSHYQCSKCSYYDIHGGLNLHHTELVDLRCKYFNKSKIPPIHIYELLKILGVKVSKYFKSKKVYRQDPESRISIGKPIEWEDGISIPRVAWTFNFCLATLKSGYKFDLIPEVFKTKEMVDMLVKVNAPLPYIFEVPLNSRTKDFCIASLNKCKDIQEKTRKLKYVPPEILEEVKELVL